MGWMELHKEKNVSYKDFFQEGLEGTIIDSYTKNGVFYGALQYSKGITALVILVRHNKGYYNFAYKWMDESFHPYYYDCPDRILDLLTPTDNEASNNWRAICRERNKTIPRKGDTVVFSKPIKFNNGSELTEFTYITGNRFERNGYIYNIKNWKNYDRTIKGE